MEEAGQKSSSAFWLLKNGGCMRAADEPQSYSTELSNGKPGYIASMQKS